MSNDIPVEHEITEVTVLTVALVVTKDAVYTRRCSDGWYISKGEQDEPIYNYDALEKTYQEYIGDESNEIM